MIEAVGLPATFQAVIDLVAFAGRVVYIGYAKEPVAYETKWFVMKKLDIRGSRNALTRDFGQVIAMIAAGRVPTERIVPQQVSLADAPAALANWDRAPGDVTKIHVHLTT